MTAQTLTTAQINALKYLALKNGWVAAGTAKVLTRLGLIQVVDYHHELTEAGANAIDTTLADIEAKRTEYRAHNLMRWFVQNDSIMATRAELMTFCRENDFDNDEELIVKAYIVAGGEIIVEDENTVPETRETTGPNICMTVELLEALHRDEAEPQSTIAQLEADLAKVRDKARDEIVELERMLGDAQAEIVSLNTKLSHEREEHQQKLSDDDGKMKAQRDISNAMMRDLEEERRHHASAVSALEGRKKDYDWLNGLFDQQAAVLEAAQTRIDELQAEIKTLKGQAPQQPPKIETKTICDPRDEALAEQLNSGWRVVFETVYVTQNDNGYGMEQSNWTHFLRLQRETQTPAYTPLDVTFPLNSQSAVTDLDPQGDR